MFVSVDILIEMVKCCYFVGNCKLCPFYKAPKFGMIGSCAGNKKVGEALLNFLISVKAKEELEQLSLLDPDRQQITEASEPNQAESDPADQQVTGKCEEPAHWIEDEYGYNRCSACGFEFGSPEEKCAVCPRCGTAMEESNEEP